MENQHRQITGYRELTQQEIDAMNEVKALAEQVGALVDRLRSGHERNAVDVDLEPADQRWVSIGATHLQQGFMALTRAIAKPETF